MDRKLISLLASLVVVFGCTIPEASPVPPTIVPPTAAPIQSPSIEKRGAVNNHTALRSKDILYLARLCVMETVGMSDDVRDTACLSVVSTALTRTELMFLSDGTLASTLSWHSGDTWQFAGYLVDGCRDDMPFRSCPDNWPDDIKIFKSLIVKFLNERYYEKAEAICDGYLFYNSIPGGNVDCLINDPVTGQFIEFYKQAYPTTAPVIIQQERTPQ